MIIPPWKTMLLNAGGNAKGSLNSNKAGQILS